MGVIRQGTPCALVRQMAAIRTLALGLAFEAFGCSGGATYVAPSGGVTQISLEESVPAVRGVLVLAIDDEATDAAAAIRAATKAGLRPTLERQFSDGLGGLSRDWWRADLRVVVVHPSIAGSGRAIGPGDDPNLSVVAEDASEGDIDSMADAAARAVDAFVAPEGARYSLLEATARTMDLLTGARAPADAHEVGLLASLGKPEKVALVIGTSRDDASAESIGSYAWWTAPLPFTLDFEATVSLLPPLPGPSVCSGLDPSTRVAAWEAASDRARGRFDVLNLACANDASSIPTFGFNSLIGDWGSLCLPASPATRPGGGAACRVRATMAEDAPCSADPRMLDPEDTDGVQRPRTVADADGSPLRVCDVHELSGAQADMCSTMATCSGCAPGWCLATVPSRTCPSGTLRFVHGAAPRGRATLDTLCDLAL